MKPGLEYLMQELLLPYAQKYFDDESLLQYQMIYAQTGMIEMIRAWLNGGCKDETEAMTQLLYDLMVKPYIKELNHDAEILTEACI